VSNVRIMTNFLTSASSFSNENYNLFLNGISKLDLKLNVHLQVSASYCDAVARQKIIDDFGWVIEDFGLDTACNYLSTGEYFDKTLTLYPNPAEGFVIVNTPLNATYTLYSIVGATLKSGALNIGENLLDISNLDNGLYLFKLNSEKGIAFKEIVKN